MDSERNPTEWRAAGERPRRLPAWAEKAVPALVVAAVSVAGVLAALLQPRSESTPARPARESCAECGVVVAVLPAADAGGARYQMRIRMDDGSLRTVEQRGAVAAGSRVVLAGGSVRVLAQRSGRV